MTREAAKNNRVQAPSSSTSSSSRTSSSEVKVSPASTKKSKGKWWCFGAGAVESDHEEIDEKQYGNPKRRSISSLEAVDVDDDVEEDEEEWSEARGTGYVSLFHQTTRILIFSRHRLLSNFSFSCAKSRSRRRATLKKKAY
jgi:hypothetical protein